MKKLLDKQMVSARTGFAISTLAQKRVRGDGPPFIKLGRKILYPEAELEAWIASHQLRRTTRGDQG